MSRLCWLDGVLPDNHTVLGHGRIHVLLRYRIPGGKSWLFNAPAQRLLFAYLALNLRLCLVGAMKNSPNYQCPQGKGILVRQICEYITQV
jgi:hypothetical protein